MISYPTLTLVVTIVWTSIWAYVHRNELIRGNKSNWVPNICGAAMMFLFLWPALLVYFAYCKFAGKEFAL